jgi:hypothetical protein
MPFSKVLVLTRAPASTSTSPSISETFTSLLLGGKGRPASLKQLRSALEGPIYSDNSGMARYLLIQLDLLHHTREYQRDGRFRTDRKKQIASCPLP